MATDARFAEFSARMDLRFSEMDRRIDARFAEQREAVPRLETLFERRFGDLIKWSFVFWCGAVGEANVSWLAGAVQGVGNRARISRGDAQ